MDMLNIDLNKIYEQFHTDVNQIALSTILSNTTYGLGYYVGIYVAE